MSDVQRTRQRLKALMFGALDLATVVTTASHLAEQGDAPLQGAEVRIRRVLDAGLVVVYSRPFVHSRRGPNLPVLQPKFESMEQKELHDQTLKQRHRVYAHTDETEFRVLLELEEPDWLKAFVDTGGTSFRETWTWATPPLLRAIAELADANREHFTSEVDRIRSHLSSL